MPDICVFSQGRGMERFWVAEADVEWWLRFGAKQGQPVARWRDFKAWGGFFPPHPETVGDEMLYPKARERQRRHRLRYG